MRSSFTLIIPRSTISVLLALVLFAMSVHAIAQKGASNPSEDRDRGIQLYQQGDSLGAVKALQSATHKTKTDLVAWHWLALAFEREVKLGDARKAHEKAAKLGDTLLMRQVDASGLDDFTSTLSRLKPQLELASESADAFIRLSPRLSKGKSQEWSERSDFLRDYKSFPRVEGLSIYKSKEVTTKARVLAKPEPMYTEDARQHQVTGTVVLRAIFAEDGTVRGIVPLFRLPHGLTAMAIRAARQIKFLPATKDGRPVSMWMQLEYNFNLY